MYAESVPLSDEALDEVHARGIQIHLDIDLDALSAGNVRSVLNTVGDQFLAQGSNLIAQQGGATNVHNVIAVGGNALQNTQSFLTVIALGDVAIGVNLQVILNPSNSTFVISSNNINFSNLFSLSQ